MPAIYYTYADSPLHPLLLTSDGSALTSLTMSDSQHGPQIEADWIQNDAAVPFPEAKRQLAAYFAGTLTAFDLPMRLHGTTFQQRVWQELTAIPYGGTISYGELARRVGNANASRAVGLANGRNPIFLIVPCHRVTGADGKLVGYGGGITRKEALLAFEAAVQTCGPHSFREPASEPNLFDTTK